ncbi:MAG: hypothetical protein ACI9MR_001138 [Myxococcota bacterium]|jgi:hypothetical protein
MGDAGGPCLVAKATQPRGADDRVLGDGRATRVPVLVAIIGVCPSQDFGLFDRVYAPRPDQRRRDAGGLEGWVSGQPLDNGFAEAWAVQFPDLGLSNNAAQGYDAVLPIAFALEHAGGATDAALLEGMAQVVAGRGAKTGWDADGVAEALAAIRRGEAPNVDGPGGEPDLRRRAARPSHQRRLPTLARWGPGRAGQLRCHAAVWERGAWGPKSLAAPTATSFVEPAASGNTLEAPTNGTRRQALIVASSTGWENDRHQADALAVYQRLRAGGMSDDEIVMVGADDIVTNPDNAEPGVVRNVPGGPNLYADVVHDYTATITSPDLLSILTGESGTDLTDVLDSDGDTNLVVGHGGSSGVNIRPDTTAQALFTAGRMFTPEDLTDALCTLRAQDRTRQALVIVEACKSGVFGDAGTGGVEVGCGDEDLEGVMVLTASNTVENSLGAGYDFDLGAWLADEFSVALQPTLEVDPTLFMRDLFQATYSGGVFRRPKPQRLRVLPPPLNGGRAVG